MFCSKVLQINDIFVAAYCLLLFFIFYTKNRRYKLFSNCPHDNNFPQIKNTISLLQYENKCGHPIFLQSCGEKKARYIHRLLLI